MEKLFVATSNAHKLEEIKEIFNKGVTIWHVDNGAEVGNYKVKNMEV